MVGGKKNLFFLLAAVIGVSLLGLHANQSASLIGLSNSLSIDKEVVHPLETLKVNYQYSDGLELRMENEDGSVTVLESFLPETGSVSVSIGGPLGLKKIYLANENGLATAPKEFRLEAETSVKTGITDLDLFYSRVKAWMKQDIFYCHGIKGYRSPDTKYIWIRDHTHQSKGFCYWEEDMISTIDWFFANQLSNGSFYDICPGGRVEVESDVEYLMVLAVYRAWQATGNNQWMFSHLSELEEGLEYMMSDSYRWDGVYRLVKRPFTIDTWDFQWKDGTNIIHSGSSFGFMSGDNSGLYEAARLLSEMYGVKGNSVKEGYWRSISDSIRSRANRYLWDEIKGYYKSFAHLGNPDLGIDIDESEILSLSNTYNMNRGDFVSHPKAVRIIQNYQNRDDAFQEWYSINPDYGNDKWGTLSADKSGEYVNGGIMPLVGGELSRAAFEHGFEKYGYQELMEYIALTKSHGNKTYLWYWPDGRPGISGPETLATDGWGSSAFLSAFIEGLAGVQDLNKLYSHVKFSPRWPVTESDEVKAVVKYGASDGYFAYNWSLKKNSLEIDFSGSGEKVDFHVLIPQNAVHVSVDGVMIGFSNEMIENSRYVNFSSEIDGVQKVVIRY